VGVNTAVARGGTSFDANNIGFALSLKEVLPVVEQMRSGEAKGPKPFLGVKIGDRTDGGSGALITGVVADGPAARAGMQQGDIVVAVDGQAVNGSGGLIGAIRDAKPGDVLVLDVERNGVRQSVRATLVERTDG
jgi:S1-C subfamily serine protease